MKILFTADIHINLRQKKVPKQWALNRYDILFKELRRVYNEYNCSLEIHGGDVFDKLPILEELEVYYNYVRSANNLIIFDGNHEATKKGETFFHVIAKTIEAQNPNAEVITGPAIREGMGFLPYTHIHNFKYSDFNTRILFTHVRGAIPPHVTPEIPLENLDPWEVVFAGDLHAHSNSQRNIVYPGSPVSVSFHRNKVETGVIVLDSETLKWEWVKIKVPQLYRKTVDKKEDIKPTDFDLTVYELTGDIMELSKVEVDNDLLDKKLVKHDVDSTLNLKNMTIREELIMYLKEIRQLRPDKIDEVMRVFDDNAKAVTLE
jgi:DNA repair exonuclease SbcCD nuclease subunit